MSVKVNKHKSHKFTPKLPLFIMDEGFVIRHALTFSKTLDEVAVRAISDDEPDTEELFADGPPDIEDFSVTMMMFKPLSIWVAHVETNFWYENGCAALLQLSAQKFAFVGYGSMTFEIQPKDEIVEFRVRLDTATPLAWIHGKNNMYFLTERKFIALKYVDDIDDPYHHVNHEACSEIRNVTDF